MTTTSVAEIDEYGGPVTLEQMLIYVDSPLIIMFVLAVLINTLTTMATKKKCSLPGVCTMFLQKSKPAYLTNSRRLRDSAIFARLTDISGKSSHWDEFRSGTNQLDFRIPECQSATLSLVEMEVRCPGVLDHTSYEYREWKESATSQLRCVMPIYIQSSYMDYEMDNPEGAKVTTSSKGIKVVYPLIPCPLKSSTQFILERGCLAWLSLCLAGLLSFILIKTNLAYSDFATAVLMNVLNILITTANVIVAVVSGVLAFGFVKILAIPFRRHKRPQRRGKYRHVTSHIHILEHDVDCIKTPVKSSPSIHSLKSDESLPEAELQDSSGFDDTENTTDAQSTPVSLDSPTEPAEQTLKDELIHREAKLAPLCKSQSLPSLDCLTLESANPSHHSLPVLASSTSLQCFPALSSFSYEKEEDLLPTRSESTTSSTFTIESLPEELRGGVYRTEKYIYTECETPWYYNHGWNDACDRPFMSSVYLDWVEKEKKNSNFSNNNNSNNNNDNNNSSNGVCTDIVYESYGDQRPSFGINITRSCAPLLLMMFAMIVAVFAFHVYVMNATLCQQTFESYLISWVIASLVLILIWLLKQICQLIYEKIRAPHILHFERLYYEDV